MNQDCGIEPDGDRWHVGGPLSFAGSFTPPGDKSIAHRAFLLAALSRGRCVLGAVPEADDVQRTRAALEGLGVRMHKSGEIYEVHGVGLHGLTPAGGAIDCGNSGTTMRLLAGVLAGQSFASELCGDASLSRRPMRRIAEPLRAMGARIACAGDDERPPLRIEPPVLGVLHGREHEIAVDSAQVRSAILFAGLVAEGWTSIRPAGHARDHSQRMLRALGVDLQVSGELHLQPPQAAWQGFEFRVPGDVSALAFFAAVAASSPNELCARNVGLNPGRRRFAEILQAAGMQVRVDVESDQLDEPMGTLRIAGRASRPIHLSGVDTVQCIDEVPALLVAAAVAGVEARIEDAAELHVKESDRIAAMAEVLRAFGAIVHEERGRIHLETATTLRPAVVDSRGDHRIAMAAATLAAATPGASVIENVACVHTSYPEFELDFARLLQPGR